MQQDFPHKERVSQKSEQRLCGGVGRSRRLPFYSVDWESTLCIISKEK